MMEVIIALKMQSFINSCHTHTHTHTHNDNPLGWYLFLKLYYDEKNHSTYREL